MLARVPKVALLLMSLATACSDNGRAAASTSSHDDAGASDGPDFSCDGNARFLGERCLTMLTCCWGPQSLAVDAESFYWTVMGGDLYKTPLSGMRWTNSSVEDPISLGYISFNPGALAIDDTSAYVTSYDRGIVRVSLGGSEPEELVPGGVSGGSIAADGSRIYWTNGQYAGAVQSVAATGGAPTILAANQAYPSAIAIDAAHVYWVTTGSPAGTGTVMRVPKVGGTPTTLASDQNHPRGIAVDATNVYWTNGGDGTVMKASLAGGTAMTLASAQEAPWAIAVDATSIYWTNYSDSFYSGDGAVMKMPLEGGTPETLAGGQFSPDDLVVDDGSVYWITTGSSNAWGTNAVMKLTPK